MVEFENLQQLWNTQTNLCSLVNVFQFTLYRKLLLQMHISPKYCISGYFRVELIFAIFASDYKTRK